MWNTVKVLQLGQLNYSETMLVPEWAEWHFEPNFDEVTEKMFDVVVLGREISEEEYHFLKDLTKAYSLFLLNNLEFETGSYTHRLYETKIGKVLSEKELQRFLNEDLIDYFPKSYGEKFKPENMAVAQGYKGHVAWDGYQGATLEGDFGTGMSQIVYWRNTIPMNESQALEFWLEYEKDDTVEIAMEIIQFFPGAVQEVQKIWRFTEEDLQEISYIENRNGRGPLFVSVKAKGYGKLKIIALHDRYSRRGKGSFIPGGKRVVTSQREEIFYYFDPGNMKPPLNVYFSGYKTQEGFEGYHMMRSMGHPFLLITEARLEGGAFYLGSEEYETLLEQIVRDHMEMLKFDHTQVILSGLSMGTFGALYYGCKIHPHTILVGKPLASLGDVAENEKILRAGGFPTSLDVLRKATGGMDRKAINQMNARFWDLFDQTDWSGTRFVSAYMFEDDYDRNAYENLLMHLKNDNVQIYGKGLHGRHNDDTRGIVSWFVNQYKMILETEF